MILFHCNLNLRLLNSTVSNQALVKSEDVFCMSIITRFVSAASLVRLVTDDGSRVPSDPDIVLFAPG